MDPGEKNHVPLCRCLYLSESLDSISAIWLFTPVSCEAERLFLARDTNPTFGMGYLHLNNQLTGFISWRSDPRAMKTDAFQTNLVDLQSFASLHSD